MFELRHVIKLKDIDNNNNVQNISKIQTNKFSHIVPIKHLPILSQQ